MKWSFLIGHLAYHLAQAVLKIRDHDAAGKERRDDVTIAKERLFGSPGYGLAIERDHARVADPSSRPAPTRSVLGSTLGWGTVWSFAAVHIAVPARRSLLNVNS